MEMDIGLLDFLSSQLNCQYLSDLKFLKKDKIKMVYKILENISEEDFSLFDWNDALEYLAEENPEQEKNKAKEKLIFVLKNKYKN